MNYIARGPKKPVNMTLSEDLVREARRLTEFIGDSRDLAGGARRRRAAQARGQGTSDRRNDPCAERAREENRSLGRRILDALMAQIDVHATSGANSRAAPYVVVVQSARFDRRPSQIVIPLVALSSSNRLDHDLAPRFPIEGQDVRLASPGTRTSP